jgi:hypothetical protein
MGRTSAKLLDLCFCSSYLCAASLSSNILAIFDSEVTITVVNIPSVKKFNGRRPN